MNALHEEARERLERLQAELCLRSDLIAGLTARTFAADLRTLLSALAELEGERDRMREALAASAATIAPLEGHSEDRVARRVASARQIARAALSPTRRDGGMSDRQPIKSAPRDGTTIQARIPGHGDDNLIAYHYIGDCAEDGGSAYGWTFVTDQEPPDDWTDGWCWAVNDAGVPSVGPTEWKSPASPTRRDGE